MLALMWPLEGLPFVSHVNDKAKGRSLYMTVQEGRQDVEAELREPPGKLVRAPAFLMLQFKWVCTIASLDTETKDIEVFQEVRTT